MKLDSRRSSSKAFGIARARLLLKADLWWITGFPAQGAQSGNWVVVPQSGNREIEGMTLTRAHLAKASFTGKRLFKKFPRALPRIVGDREAWFDAMTSLLGQLQPLVDRNDRPPKSLFEEEGLHATPLREKAASLSASHRGLRPVISAISWIHYTAPDRANSSLDWLDSNADLLLRIMANVPGDLRTTTVLNLDRLSAVTSGRHISALLECLADPVLYSARAKDSEKPGSALITWVTWLTLQDEAIVRNSLRLFSKVDPAAAIDLWMGWERGEGRLAATTRAQSNRGLSKVGRNKDLERSQSKSSEKKAGTSGPVPVDELVSALKMFVEPDCQGTLRAIEKTLPSLPTQFRAPFLVHWFQVGRPPGSPESARLPALIREFGVYKRKVEITDPSLVPWVECLEKERKGSMPWSIDDSLVDEDSKDRDASLFFRALPTLRERILGPLDDEILERLLDLLRITNDADRSVELIAVLASAGRHEEPFPTYLVRQACDLCEDDPRDFPAVLEGLGRIDKGLRSPADTHLGALVGHFEDEPKALRAILMDLDGTGILRCALLISFLDTCGAREVPRPGLQAYDGSPPDWLISLPDLLHEPVMALLAVDEQAQKTTNRILRRDFPEPAAMLKELETLRGKLASADADNEERLRKRVASLTRRLDAPEQPSPVRLERLRGKLFAAARAGVVGEWQSRLWAVAEACFKSLLDISSTPTWFHKESTLRILGALGGLDRSARDLAIRLLRVRVGAPPWDLREEPENAAFLERLLKSGIHTDPWQNGVGVSVFHDHMGREIHVSMEDDPLEILQMGYHFGTCLSPGDCYFSSAVANAADINKRVIYARAEDEAVVGRCLVALTQEGAIVTFFPFCHDKQLDFRDMVKEFIESLRSSMETIVVPEGDVPTLMSEDWWDDGPVDVARRFPFLEEGSEFRESLSVIGSKEFLGQLKGLFAPLPLNALTLPLVLELDEVQARPELLRPLLRMAESLDLTVPTRMRIALLAERIGAEDLALRNLRRWGVGHVVDSFQKHHFLDLEVLHALARRAPALALRALRGTRGKGVRRWADEYVADRLYIAAVATAALNRPRQAQELFRLASTCKSATQEMKECAGAQVRKISAEFHGASR